MDLINSCFETTHTVRQLALYSHLLPVFVSMTLGYFVYRFSSRRTCSILFGLFTLLLSLWLISDLIAWHSNNYYLVAAFWSILDYISILFYLVLACFFIVQTLKLQRMPNKLNFLVFLIALPPLILTVTGTSVGVFDETNCEMAGNNFLASYKLGIELLSIITIFYLGMYASVKHWKEKQYRNQVLVLMLSSVIFLAIFSSADYIAVYTDIFEISLYALFTLPIFLVILTFNIIEQGTFNLKGDSFTLAKLLFFIFILVAIFNLVLADDTLEFGITWASTIVTSGFGLLLLRSARREVHQRKQIETLATNLERVNIRLQALDKQKSEFVSIASHQLRSPLTAIRGYAAMFLDGSYGSLTQKQTEPLNRIGESAKLMASSIEDFLNVSRIESGNMKYEYSDFSIAEQASHIVDDLRPEALRSGLVLLYRSDLTSKGFVHADIGKTQQILHNLINNSLKYTQKGTINVFAHENLRLKKMYIEIIDTGIGISAETIRDLFEKFSRAKNANTVNIKGTGLGLFVAREMARAMSGDITAHSEGEGKGSHFVLTLPLLN